MKKTTKTVTAPATPTFKEKLAAIDAKLAKDLHDLFTNDPKLAAMLTPLKGNYGKSRKR
jgi:hypothetical protein